MPEKCPTVQFDHRCKLRYMRQNDLQQVLAIERASFRFPWSKTDFVRQVGPVNCGGIVYEWNKTVLGYSVYESHGSHILLNNIAVCPDVRRRHIARSLVQLLATKIPSPSHSHIRVRVCERNLAAQLFFRSVGFRATAILRSYYANSDDAYVMVYALPNHHPSFARFSRSKADRV